MKDANPAIDVSLIVASIDIVYGSRRAYLLCVAEEAYYQALRQQMVSQWAGGNKHSSPSFDADVRKGTHFFFKVRNK